MANSKRKIVVLVAALAILAVILGALSSHRTRTATESDPAIRELNEQLTEKFRDLVKAQDLAKNQRVIFWQVESSDQQAPLTSFVGYSALVAQDGTVGIVAYGYDNAGMAELAPVPDQTYDQPFLVVIENWTAPEEWRGQCLLINSIYVYDVMNDQLSAIDHIVYVVQNIALARENFADMVKDDLPCWIWQDGEYACRPYSEVSRRNIDDSSTESPPGDSFLGLGLSLI